MTRYLRIMAAVLAGAAIAALAVSGGALGQSKDKVEEWSVIHIEGPLSGEGEALVIGKMSGGGVITTERSTYESKPAIRQTARMQGHVTVESVSFEMRIEGTAYYTPEGRPLYDKTVFTVTGAFARTVEVTYHEDSLSYKITEDGETQEGRVDLPKGKEFTRSLDIPLCDVPLKPGATYQGVDFDDNTHALVRERYDVVREEDVETSSGTEKAFYVTYKCSDGSEGKYWLRKDHTTMRFEEDDADGTHYRGAGATRSQAEGEQKGK
jgi:hypothetical protein